MVVTALPPISRRQHLRSRVTMFKVHAVKEGRFTHHLQLSAVL